MNSRIIIFSIALTMLALILTAGRVSHNSSGIAMGENGTRIGSIYVGQDSFSGTAQTDTVVIANFTTDWEVFFTYTGNGLIGNAEAVSAVKKATGYFILLRNSSGISGQTYDYMAVETP